MFFFIIAINYSIVSYCINNQQNAIIGYHNLVKGCADSLCSINHTIKIVKPDFNLTIIVTII
jgi:hypothetical protein